MSQGISLLVGFEGSGRFSRVCLFSACSGFNEMVFVGLLRLQGLMRHRKSY